MHTIVQVLINDDSDRTITGIILYDREQGGTFIPPAAAAFPATDLQAGELFYRTDEDVLYRRNEANDGWTVVNGNAAIALGGDLTGTTAAAQVVDLTITDEEQGSILYNNGSNWVQLTPGTSNQVLKTKGTGNNPTWASISYDNTKVVAQNGSGDYTSIRLALEDVNATADASNPKAVLVYPGLYTEAPMLVGENVTLAGQGLVVIQASDNDNPLVTMETGALARKINLRGPTNSPTVVPAAGAFNPVFEASVFESGLFGGWVNDATASLIISDSRFAPGLANSIIVNAGNAACTQSLDLSAGGFQVTGATSALSLSFSRISGSSTGVFVNDGGTVLGQAIRMTGVGIGVQTGTTNPETITVDFASLQISGATTWDIQQQAAGAQISIASGFFRKNQISAIDWTDLRLVYLDNSPKDDAYEVLSDLNVGNAERPSTSAFGEGASYALGVTVLTTDDTTTGTTDGGNFTDVSTIASTNDGVTFTFQGTGAGHSILIGSKRTFEGSPVKFWGVQIAQVVAVLPYADIDTYVFEYWDGTNWTEFPLLVTEEEQFYVYGKSALGRANSLENLRFGLRGETNWVTKNIDSMDIYWVRIRKTATANNPTFNQIKLHTSHAEINNGGRLSLFGRSRVRQTLFTAGNIFGESGGVANFNTSVGTGDIVGGPNPPQIWAHQVKNSNLTTNGEAIYFQFEIPRGTDTSLPMTLRFTYVVTSAGVGTSEFYIGFHPVEVIGTAVADTSGGIIPVPRPQAETTPQGGGSGIAAQTDTITHTIVDSTYVGSFESKDFDISSYYEGDIIFVRLEAEDLEGAFGILAASISRYTWTLGERS
jgi:hypothetical protein